MVPFLLAHTQPITSTTKNVFVKIFFDKYQHSVSQVCSYYFAVQWASVAVVSLDNNHHFKWGGKNTEWPRVEEDKQANHTAPSLLTQSAVVCRSQDWYLHQGCYASGTTEFVSPAGPRKGLTQVRPWFAFATLRYIYVHYIDFTRLGWHP